MAQTFGWQGLLVLVTAAAGCARSCGSDEADADEDGPVDPE